MKKFSKMFVIYGMLLLSSCSIAYCDPVTETREQVSLGINKDGEFVYSIRYKGTVDPDCKVNDIVEQFNRNVLGRIKYDEDTAYSLIQAFKNSQKTFGEFKEEVLRRFAAASNENKMSGSCLMFSIIMEDILSSNGIENYIMDVGKDHAANLYKVGEKWFIADATRALEVSLRDEMKVAKKIIPYDHTLLDIPQKDYTQFMKVAVGTDIVNEWIQDNSPDKSLSFLPQLRLGVNIDLNNHNLSSRSLWMPLEEFLSSRELAAVSVIPIPVVAI